MTSTRDISTTPPSPPPPSAPPPQGNVPPPIPDPGGSKTPKPSAALLVGVATAVIVGAIFLQGGDNPATNLLNPVSSLLGPETSFIADGPFAYRFTKGEVLNYQLDARASGTGFETGVGSKIGLTMNMLYSLETTAIDREGNGTLVLEFDEVKMTGNFMGEPVNLYQSGSETQMSLNRHDQLDTRQGDSVKGIPQLEFFKKPITMVVGPDGHVIDVQGAPGFDSILSPSKAMAPSRFTASQLEIGDTWTSEFNLPVPGLAIPASATTQNTLVEYVMIGGRNCGVIKQEMLSVQADGQLNSPSSVLGEEMGFTMPTFEVSGVNMIYFDVDGGKLVRTEMNLFFKLEIGEELEGLKGALGAYSSILGELENPNRRPKRGEEPEPLLDMGVEIAATLALVE